MKFTPGGSPNINYGLWGIMICPRRFIDNNKWTTALVGDVNNGRGCAHGGFREHLGEQALNLPLNFSVNLKLL